MNGDSQELVKVITKNIEDNIKRIEDKMDEHIKTSEGFRQRVANLEGSNKWNDWFTKGLAFAAITLLVYFIRSI
jgi:hypothetical protein